MKLKPVFVGLLFATVGTNAFAAASQTRLNPKGTGSIHASTASSETGYETRTGPGVDSSFNRQISGTMSPARVPADHVPTPAASSVAGTASGILGFNGLSHVDQRLASGGNQFSLEPPDQALAASSSFVVESVNLAVAVYSTSGNLLAGPAALNAFFGLPPALLRTAPPVYGPFLSDPRAYYDAGTGRWFLTVLEIAADPATGALLGNSNILIAVSQTSDPTGNWNLFSLDTTDVTGTAAHAGCPCFGDQPLIGADQYGFYISTNEFSIAGSAFNGSQIYAISKAALESGLPSAAAHFEGLTLAEGVAYSVQPAITPPGGAFETANNGTEYFLSALDFNSTLDNRLGVWAMTNTASLNSTVPNVTLTNTVIASEVYGLPPSIQQRSGPTPLADLLATKNNILGITTHEHLELVDGDDDRLQQVVFAAGSLWTSLGTVVKGPTGTVRVGAAWFVVNPVWSNGALGASVANQGYVAPGGDSVSYPSIGVNASGKGVMTFTLIGPDYYPSLAFATIDAIHGTGAIQIAASGAGPDDGFTGYGAFGGRVGRWGDYTTAVAAPDGSIWFAGEYIPGGPRTVLANWGTFIGKFVP